MSFPLDEDTLPRDQFEALFLQRLPGGRSMRHIFGPGVASAYKYQEALLDMALEMGANADSMVPPHLFAVDSDGAESPLSHRRPSTPREHALPRRAGRARAGRARVARFHRCQVGLCQCQPLMWVSWAEA